MMGKLTLFFEVVRLLVLNTRRPPFRLRLLRVTLLTRGCTRRRLTAIVGVLDLLSGFNKLDKRLGDLPAVDLLEVLQGTFVVRKDLFSVANFKAHHVTSRGRRHISGLGKLFFKDVLGGAAASDPTGVWPAVFFGVPVAIAHRSTLERGRTCFT